MWIWHTGFGFGNPECSRYIHLILNYLSLHKLRDATKELIVRSKFLCSLLLVLGLDAHCLHGLCTGALYTEQHIMKCLH